MRTLASIYLASSSKAFIPCSIGDSTSGRRKEDEVENCLPRALSRYHFQAACMRD